MSGEAAYRIHRYGAEPDQYGEYWPGRGPALMVLIHGGYWRHKYGLDLMHPMAADLQARGYAVWNVEYRRMDTPGGGWPGTFEDVAAAVAAVADLGAETPALRRVGLIGHSAGGQLALWAAATRKTARHARRVVPAVVVSLAGVCDLTTAAQLGLSSAAVEQLLGGAPQERPEVYAQADPMAVAPLGVTQLLVHGTADEDVPYDLTLRYAAVAGPRATLLTLPGADHFELIDPQSRAWERVMEELSLLLPPGTGRL